MWPREMLTTHRVQGYENTMQCLWISISYVFHRNFICLCLLVREVQMYYFCREQLWASYFSAMWSICFLEGPLVRGFTASITYYIVHSMTDRDALYMYPLLNQCLYRIVQVNYACYVSRACAIVLTCTSILAYPCRVQQVYIAAESLVWLVFHAKVGNYCIGYPH